MNEGDIVKESSEESASDLIGGVGGLRCLRVGGWER